MPSVSHLPYIMLSVLLQRQEFLRINYILFILPQCKPALRQYMCMPLLKLKYTTAVKWQKAPLL